MVSGCPTMPYGLTETLLPLLSDITNSPKRQTGNLQISQLAVFDRRTSTSSQISTQCGVLEGREGGGTQLPGLAGRSFRNSCLCYCFSKRFKLQWQSNQLVQYILCVHTLYLYNCTCGSHMTKEQRGARKMLVTWVWQISELCGPAAQRRTHEFARNNFAF